MDYCKIQEEADLPKLWLVLAKSNKKPDLVFIQDLVNQYAMELSQYYCIAPIISPQLVQDLINFDFVAPSADDTKASLQPFMIVDGTEEH